jgi:hypothetical protein
LLPVSPQVEEETGRVLLRWARVRVATPWGQRISSLEAWEHYTEWQVCHAAFSETRLLYISFVYLSFIVLLKWKHIVSRPCDCL